MQEQRIEKWKCAWSPTLGKLEDTAEKIWGTEEYLGEYGPSGLYPTIFFGLYGLPDFYKLWRHKGRKCILWAGTDIKHFLAGYWLDDIGSIRMSVAPLATWIRKHCESYVENEVEADALRKHGIEAKIIPSFLGNVNDFPLCYEPTIVIKLYTSVSGNNFEQYGWNKIHDLAYRHKDIEFHLYGNDKPFHDCDTLENVIVHGRIPKEQMNAEIKEMTGALRLTKFDGFSEIIAKSLLWGQWPVSIINYPHVIPIEHIGKMKNFIKPNHDGRAWLLSVVNKYPWNQK